MYTTEKKAQTQINGFLREPSDLRLYSDPQLCTCIFTDGGHTLVNL